MGQREKIVKDVLTTYAAQVETWDKWNYPKWNIVGEWETPEQAYEQIRPNLEKYTGKYRITKHVYSLLDSGRFTRHDMVTVFEDGKWHDEYDPRRKDPDFVKYLDLKKRFEK